jgi:hypothetical protein
MIAAQRDFGKMHSADLQLVKANCSCDDVDDRIGGADFVKMNFFRSCTVDFSLGFGQTLEDLDARFFDLVGQIACLYELANLFPGARRFMTRRLYLKMCRSDRVDSFFCNIEFEFECGNFSQFPTKNFQRKPQVQKRRDEHVAADSADQITVGNSHHFT